MDVSEYASLLIEPVWNWNWCCNAQDAPYAPLLIEPVWNWNSFGSSYFNASNRTFNRTSLELKLGFQIETHGRTLAFNRTSLELKPARMNAAPPLSLELLIEPVWNWNLGELDLSGIHWVTFNRTSLELKPENWRPSQSARFWLLIEPVWNWNSFPPNRYWILWHAF